MLTHIVRTPSISVGGPWLSLIPSPDPHPATPTLSSLAPTANAVVD